MSPFSTLQATWQSVRSILEASVSPIPDNEQLQHFHVDLQVERALTNHGEVLIPGRLLSSWKADQPDQVSCSTRKVLVRLTTTDWIAVAKHCKRIRILQARVLHGTTGPIIDATLPVTAVAGHTTLLAHEQIQVAELFAGSFLGWTQAAYVIHKGFHALRTRLLLDKDPACCTAASFTHAPLSPVSSPQELTLALRGDCNMFVVGDIAASWWYKALALPEIRIWCASPPCQPFSTAGRGSGLSVVDGQAILHLTSLLEVIQPPVLCIEQVRGFATHPHFGFLRELWNSLGYQLLWSDVVDLHDFAPSTRPRYLASSSVRMLFFLLQASQTLALCCQSDPAWGTLAASWICLSRSFGTACLMTTCAKSTRTLSTFLNPTARPVSRVLPHTVCVDRVTKRDASWHVTTTSMSYPRTV